ncbi:hypothetical protein HanXRQr2_Chr14g0642921 [Helianthus annuus]|uniref:Uncharacterized protein n=1 Tax=Helianthus annuus TaxID=4232 RepID=A0A251SHM0_HELAN|nr:hypothetical protein HanXRQr2_Chr14g0642921 [Helianthus annuus]KAJ0840278.1 hypothetical protein HanPSC8_Chr14g0616791 [Helianthus annuus]
MQYMFLILIFTKSSSSTSRQSLYSSISAPASRLTSDRFNSTSDEINHSMLETMQSGVRKLDVNITKLRQSQWGV